MNSGPLSTRIEAAGAAEGAAVLGGIEALFGGLLHLSFGKDGLVLYEKRLNEAKWLLLLQGNATEVVQAKTLLEAAGSE